MGSCGIVPPRERWTVSRLRTALAGLLLLAHAGCSDGITQSPVGPASVRVSANVSGTAVNTIVIRVTAADLRSPLVYNLPVYAGAATGTLHVPPGPTRHFAVEAFDHSGLVTHEGTVTTDVQRGTNPPLSIVLQPRAGNIPITIGIGSFRVVITPSSVVMTVGGKLQLTAGVTDNEGRPVDGAVVAWASVDPARATVSADGIVMAYEAGPVQVMAVYGGAGGTANIEVSERE
jgi:hypothetical protein